MTPERLQQIKDADARRTQGEWPIRRVYGEENDAFIALASTAIPELVAEVEDRDAQHKVNVAYWESVDKRRRHLEAEVKKLRGALRDVIASDEQGVNMTDAIKRALAALERTP